MRTTIDWLPANHEALHDKVQQTCNYFLDPMNRDRMGFGSNTPYGQWFARRERPLERNTECDNTVMRNA